MVIFHVEYRSSELPPSQSPYLNKPESSHDVIALDTRIVGIFKKYFGYNLNARQVQSNRAIYVSLEAALREFCREKQVSLAFLDRLLFNFSDLSIIELVVNHPQLIGCLR